MSLVKNLKLQIKEIQDKIGQLQAECNHPNSARTIQHRGSTGGYDADTYWDEHTCGLCEKFWSVDRE